MKRVMHIKKILISLGVFCAIATPLGVMAAAPEFYPIVPLPQIDYSKNPSLGKYVNQLFRLSISLGGILAVLMLILGGFEYMTGAKAGDKKNGLDRIRGAVIGLILLLSVYLLLSVINPCILEISVFTNESNKCSPALGSQKAGAAATPAAPARPSAGVETLQNGECFKGVAAYCSDGTETVVVCRMSDTGNTYTDSVSGECRQGTPTYLCKSGGCFTEEIKPVPENATIVPRADACPNEKKNRYDICKYTAGYFTGTNCQPEIAKQAMCLKDPL